MISEAYGPNGPITVGNIADWSVVDWAAQPPTLIAPGQPQVGVKFDQDKPKWSLLPHGVVSQVVEVLTFGAKKYSPDNWKKINPERYYDALWRHVEAWRNGETKDPESGKHHLAHALCCLMFMLWFDNNKNTNPHT